MIEAMAQEVMRPTGSVGVVSLAEDTRPFNPLFGLASGAIISYQNRNQVVVLWSDRGQIAVTIPETQLDILRGCLATTTSSTTIAPPQPLEIDIFEVVETSPFCLDQAQFVDYDPFS